MADPTRMLLAFDAGHRLGYLGRTGALGAWSLCRVLDV